MSAKCSWGGPGDESAAQTEGTEPGRSAQRRVRSSAFPSSLNWDSDSEKETLDGNMALLSVWHLLQEEKGSSIDRRKLTDSSNF